MTENPWLCPDVVLLLFPSGPTAENWNFCWDSATILYRIEILNFILSGYGVMQFSVSLNGAMAILLKIVMHFAAFYGSSWGIGRDIILSAFQYAEAARDFA